MATSEHQLDVRQITPIQRHGIIFATFGQLGLNESFILINDHDPKHLYYQFQAELTATFSWEYIENGPEIWRVRIGKVKDENH